MWNKIKSFFVKKHTPKVVICFEQTGCMATGREFMWIGYVVREYHRGDHKYDHKYAQVDMYDVQPLVFGASENRNHQDKPLPIQQAWQIQYLGNNLYIHYV